MVEAEFDLLWDRQSAHHPEILTPDAKARIRDILLFQRPLRAVRPGRCSLDPGIDRAPLALPSAQRFRIWQEINNLRWRRPGETMEHPLADEQRRAVFGLLELNSKKSFAAIRRAAKLPADALFNLQGAKREFLLGNCVGASLGGDECFGSAWGLMSPDEQDAVVLQLVDDGLSDEVLLTRLVHDYQLGQEQAERVLSVKTPDGYARLGARTIQKLLPHLEAGLAFDRAVVAAGFEGTNTQGDGSLPELPYYGKVLERHVAFGTGEGNDEQRYGRIANPSVHIALNQLRHLVNALVKRYGKPQEIVLELARDIKLSWQKAKEIEADQADRQRENEALREQLLELGFPANGENLLRLRLHKELCGTDGLSASCVYTGEQISIARLFSPDVEVDHILPFSRTLDDSIANKVLCVARANRVKGDCSPLEAFGHSPSGYSWEQILERASRLRRNRYRRFSEDAMQKFVEAGGFIARQLSDTAYMSRLAREYVSFICPPNQVWTTTGQLTGMLRAKWGLNKLLSHDDLKNRRDHRHHAIDAVVIATIDRSLVKRVSDASARASSIHSGRLFDNLEHPWGTFLLGLQNALDRVVVSYRPDHAAAGPLHNDTAYGAADKGGADVPGVAVKSVVHHFVPLSSVADRKPDDVRTSVRGKWLADSLAKIVDTHGADKRSTRAALDAFGQLHGIRKVRWIENQTVIPVADRKHGRVYKYLVGDGNHCYEIFEGKSGRWAGRIVSRFVANGAAYRMFSASEEYRSRTFEGEPLRLRLIQGDCVRVHVDGLDRVYRVQKFTEGVITLAYHLGAGDQTRNPLLISGIKPVIRVAPSALQSLRGRRVFVDILGRVFDPGFKDVAPDTGSRG
jgi:CRISPR-associated endonuclease Csn1